MKVISRLTGGLPRWVQGFQGVGRGGSCDPGETIDSVSPLFSVDFDQLQMIRAQHLLLAYNRFWNGDDGRKKKADNRSLCPHDGDPHDVQAA